MEWYSIEFLYPQAFDMFIKKMYPNVGLMSLSTLEGFDLKKLYKFFDDAGIYLTVEMYRPHQWVFTISLENGIVVGPTQESKKTREQCEIDGFFDCFRLLDKKIKDRK